MHFNDKLRDFSKWQAGENSLQIYLVWSCLLYYNLYNNHFGINYYTILLITLTANYSEENARMQFNSVGSRNPVQEVINVLWGCTGSELQLLNCSQNQSDISCSNLKKAGVYCYGKQ